MGSREYRRHRRVPGRRGAEDGGPGQDRLAQHCRVGSRAAGLPSSELWESQTLKQPDLKVYVADNIYYTRDPWGGYEVVVVPVTIQNSGARDDAVIALQLDVTTATGTTERFFGTYTADAQYFGSSDDVTTRKRRPKQPFAPLSVSGAAPTLALSCSTHGSTRSSPSSNPSRRSG